MIWFYRIFRAICVMVIVLLIVVPMLIYVMLTLPVVQNSMCRRAESELSSLLQTPVSIESLSIAPFNRLMLRGVVVETECGDTIMKIRKMGAGVSLSSLVGSERLTVNYAELTGLTLWLSRDSINGPLNIGPIIKKLSGKEKKADSSSIDLAVNTVVIRRSSFFYDVKSEPMGDGNRFDINHVGITDFRADISLPQIKNNEFNVDINRVAFCENSGLSVDDFHGNFIISDKLLSVKNLEINLPNSSFVFGDMSLAINGWNDIEDALSRERVTVELTDKSYFEPTDFAMFVPEIVDVDEPIDISFKITGTTNRFDIDNFSLLSKSRMFKMSMNGSIENVDSIESMSFKIPHFDITANSKNLCRQIRNIKGISPEMLRLSENMGNIHVRSEIHGTLDCIETKTDMTTDIGNVKSDLVYRKANRYAPVCLSGEVSVSDVDLLTITGNDEFGSLSADVTGSVELNNKIPDGQVLLTVGNLEFRNHVYDNVLIAMSSENGNVDCKLNIDDPCGQLSVDAGAILSDKNILLKVDVDIKDLNLNKLNVIEGYDDYVLSTRLTADYGGWMPDTSSADLRIEYLKFVNCNGLPSLNIKDLSLTASADSLPSKIELRSEFLDATLTGSYSFATLIPAVREIMAESFPVYFESDRSIVPSTQPRVNDFIVKAEIKYDDELNRFLKLPVNVIYPVTINASMNHPRRSMSLEVDAPYLQQKDKLIEGTALKFSAGKADTGSGVFFTTTTPTKDGGMTLELICHGENNRLDSDLSWKIDRKRLYSGNIDVSTLFARDNEDNNVFDVTINPSKIVFNDSVWNVKGARIIADRGSIDVRNFDVGRDNQFVTMNGMVSADSVDVLTLELLNINLDYIFETLAIDNVSVGGDATGKFYISQLFSKEPRLLTPGLEVKGISYNKAILGDAVVKSRWDNELQEVTLDIDISQYDKRKSRIYGGIFPMRDSLDLRFDVDRINIGFLKSYMSAFADHVEGKASGDAHLYGNFKYIDLEGNLFAEDLKLKLDVTNTTYSCTDSVLITPGRINLRDITIHDIYGHSATLNGIVTHTFFKNATFDFAISNARDFLAYDTNASINPDWYGKIFGNGSVYVKGEPGAVKVNVDMSTAPSSVFTFVLSDLEEANEYSFITFRNRDLIAKKDSLDSRDPTLKLIDSLRQRMNSDSDDSPSIYDINIQIDITPEATLYIVMDPVGGDRIRTNGTGSMRMNYNSANEDLKMYGTYTLDRGSYNFTLQDIIIKDFSIKPGSTISFHGNPYAAQLGIYATYQLNANLSDLDESFLQDKELNRTNVPVHAVLIVTGDIRQPSIGFDLEFPTLTSDTYRKVKSIISTEEMMNRQIIYLLALNRFYTPDYMGATTKGNELVSVASSTISSQLSSMLGQLSDNWSIAPNFRSDRGDFSDVEVDLALSSNLLNNRLLFNGNFGYRDKSMNTNQFIGDFDLEYLLNKQGTVRLKAYNRYNDQNYYIKTATTTQGVGIVFKRDFDSMFSFLGRLRRQLKESLDTDSLSVPTDTVTVPILQNSATDNGHN